VGAEKISADCVVSVEEGTEEEVLTIESNVCEMVCKRVAVCSGLVQSNIYTVHLVHCVAKCT